MREPRRPTVPPLTGSESIAITLVAVPALLVVAAFAGDQFGAAFRPAVMLGIAAGFGAAMVRSLLRVARWEFAESLAFLTIITATFAWLLWIAKPSFFPLGGGPDLTHHLLLINYIEANWRLVHDPAAQEFLGEMVQYTPGSHILTALAGAWSRSNGLHAIHTVMAASAALKSGGVFLIAMRLLPRDLPRVPFATLASISLFASQTYFLGSFAQYSFLAQVVAEGFAVAMWWALLVWDQDQHRWPIFMAGLLGAAIFLTWPILIGPPLVLLGVLVVLPSVRVRLPDAPYLEQFREKAVDAFITVVPIVIVAALFSAGRMNYVAIAGTGGEAVWPAVRAYGWLFFAFSSAGILMAAAHLMPNLKVRTSPDGRTLPLVTAAILLQAGALYAFARSRGNDPYMMRKMFYMLLYPQAVGVAVAVATTWRLVGLPKGRLLQVASWALAIVAFFFVARPLIGAPRSLIVARHPATSLELEQAGKWVRDHVDPHCVEYLVGDDNTAYWLHLAVLRNPRRGSRTGDNSTYELTPALVRWLTPGGLPYAIADLRVLPTDIKDASDIVVQFGTAAVIRRHGPASCGS